MSPLRRCVQAVVIGLCGASVVSSAQTYKPRAKVKQDVQIPIILTEVSGDCDWTRLPRAVAYTGKKVTFQVFNYCSEDLTINLKNFKLKGGSPKEFSADPKKAMSVAAYGGADSFTVTVRAKAGTDDPSGIYKFDIDLGGGRVLDPEVEVKDVP